MGGPKVWAGQLMEATDTYGFVADSLDLEARGLVQRLLVQFLPPVRAAWLLHQALRERGRYDAIHVSNSLWDGAALSWLASRAGIPVRVVHWHQRSPLMGRVYRGAFWVGLARRWVLRHATHLLAVSADVGAEVLGPEIVRDPRFRVLPAAIDLAPFRQPVDAAALRAALGIPADSPVVGHVGRFAPEKNHALLVQAAAEVLRQRPDVVFLLVGDGVLRAATEQQVTDLGIADRFRFAGERTDVAALMKGAMDVLLFPSTSEGLPRVVLEAQAAGLSCVLSDIIPQEVDIVPSLIQRRSLSDPPQVWAEAVLRAIANGPAVSREEAFKAVERSPASMEVSARCLESIYLESRR